MKVVIIFLLLFLIAPQAYALNIAFVKNVSNKFDLFYNLLKEEHILLLLLAVISTLLLYAVYASEYRIICRAEKKEFTIRKKTFTFVLALLSTMGIFYFTSDVGFVRVVQKIVGSAGIIGRASIGVALFFIIQHGFRDKYGYGSWRIAMATVGTAMLVNGALQSSKDVVGVGMLFLFGALAGFIIGTGYETNPKVRHFVNSSLRRVGINTSKIERPGYVPNFYVERIGNKIVLSWQNNHPLDKVAFYQIQRRIRKAHMLEFMESWERGTHQPLPEGWVKIIQTRTAPAGGVEDKEIEQLIVVMKEPGLVLKFGLDYRIRAINIYGNAGPWKAISLTESTNSAGNKKNI